MSKTQNRYARAAKEAMTEYNSTTHPTEIQRLITSNTWTIDRIVIVGLGESWYQFAMIWHLKLLLQDQTKNDIKIYAQEIYDGLDDPYDYVACLKNYDVISLNGLNEWSAGPIHALVSSTTLLYAPWCNIRVIIELLRETDPELYIGVPMDDLASADLMKFEEFWKKEGSQEDSQEQELEERDRKRVKLTQKKDLPRGESKEMDLHEKKLRKQKGLGRIARVFARGHEWRALPPTYPAGHPDENLNSAHGDFEGLFMYRRRDAWSQSLSTCELGDSEGEGHISAEDDPWFIGRRRMECSYL